MQFRLQLSVRILDIVRKAFWAKRLFWQNFVGRQTVFRLYSSSYLSCTC
jgi:hypothetical protein